MVSKFLTCVQNLDLKGLEDFWSSNGKHHYDLDSRDAKWYISQVENIKTIVLIPKDALLYFATYGSAWLRGVISIKRPWRDNDIITCVSSFCRTDMTDTIPYDRLIEFMDCYSSAQVWERVLEKGLCKDKAMLIRKLTPTMDNLDKIIKVEPHEVPAQIEMIKFKIHHKKPLERLENYYEVYMELTRDCYNSKNYVQISKLYPEYWHTNARRLLNYAIKHHDLKFVMALLEKFPNMVLHRKESRRLLECTKPTEEQRTFIESRMVSPSS